MSVSAQSKTTTTTTQSQPSSNKAWKENLFQFVDDDMKLARWEYFIGAPSFLTSLLGIKKQDELLFHCFFESFVANTLHLCILPFAMSWSCWTLTLITLARILVFGAPRFVLCLHYASHTPIFKPVWLNHFLFEILMAPFVGILPGSYRVHHVVMHHKEDNIFPGDLSSTMPFQRDSVFHWLLYFFRFLFLLKFELPYWLFKKRYLGHLARLSFGLCSGYFLSYQLYCIRPAFCWSVFVFPELLSAVMLMLGNWGQHIFVDPLDYDNDHKLTYNVVSSPYNLKSFNDGYHIIHHKYQSLHFSQMPRRFLSDKELQAHADADAFTFKHLDFFLIAVLVLLGFDWCYDILTDKFVPISQKQADRTKADLIKEMKRRLVPIYPPQYLKQQNKKKQA